MSLPFSSVASRLCADCGICCNGVMFHKVRVQSGDSIREIMAFGLKLKRQHGELYILQPCPAHQGVQCALYQQRPERCRLFECRQLRRVASGEISESAALEKIKEAVQRVASINQLLHESGKTNGKKPLRKRYEKITAEPVDRSSDPESMALRDRLTFAMQELEEMLERDFRIDAPIEFLDGLSARADGDSSELA